MTNKTENRRSLDDVFELLAAIHQDVKKNTDEAKVYKEELEKTKERVESLENAQTIIVAELQNLSKVVEVQDSQRRKKNLILYRYPEKDNETPLTLLTDFIELIKEKLDITLQKIEVDYITRLGRRRTDGLRPVLIRFNSTWRKYELLSVNKKMAEFDLNFADDLPLKIRRIRKELIPYLIEARENNTRAYLRRDKLLMNGRLYSVEQLQRNKSFMKANCPPNPEDRDASTSKQPPIDKISNSPKKRSYDASGLAKRASATLEKFTFGRRAESFTSPPRKISVP